MHPIRELAQTAREFRHLRAEHHREGVRGGWRRRQEADLVRLERHFAALLERWVPDPDTRARWERHIHHGDAEPEVLVHDPLLFRGRSANGSVLEIREGDGDERAVLIDGTRCDHIPKERPIDVPFSYGDSTFEETFDLPTEAIQALADHLGGRRVAPPWQWAPVLYEQGIIDSNFGLTGRGHRLVRRG
jgi:hypothetical protein